MPIKAGPPRKRKYDYDDCPIEGCDQPRQPGHPHCGKHSRRYRLYGDPLVVLKIAKRPEGLLCEAEGCSNPRKATSAHWCDMHLTRLRRHGDLDADHGAKRQATATYMIAHKWVRKDRGKASAHPCVDCAGPAAQWSYDHADPAELVDNNVRGTRFALPYSLDVSHYQPRCVSCHVVWDKAWSGAGL